MADVANKFPQNVPGRFYVDDQCIDCDLCRETAPANFWTPILAAFRDFLLRLIPHQQGAEWLQREGSGREAWGDSLLPSKSASLLRFLVFGLPHPDRRPAFSCRRAAFCLGSVQLQRVRILRAVPEANYSHHGGKDAATTYTSFRLSNHRVTPLPNFDG